MLKLKDISFPEKILDMSDFYLKIKLFFREEVEIGGLICYWSTYGPQETFIEIGIRKPTQEVYKITVVTLPEIIYVNNHFQNHENVKQIEGIPLFELDAWHNEPKTPIYDSRFYQKDYYIREKKDFKIIVTKTSVIILFSPEKAHLLVVNEFVVFGFDQENFLCFIQLEQMTLDDEKILKKIN